MCIRFESRKICVAGNQCDDSDFDVHISLVTPCYPSSPMLPFVTPCYPLLPFVTPCYPCYPLLPLVTLVTLVTLCYPCYPCYP